VAGCLTRGFVSEAAVCARLGVSDFDALEGEGRARLAAHFQGTSLADLLIRLFVLGRMVPVAEAQAAMHPDEIETMEALGLLGRVEAAGDGAAHVFSPLRVVPIADGSVDARTLFIASDRDDAPDGSRFEPFADIVFSGHNPLTRQFLRLLPAARTGAVLDLCSGTGIAALVSEAAAERVIAVDITARCTEFARFNRWLNHADRVDVRQGDLYAPVTGERFDRVIAHPPYVPALSEKLIYRDAGEIGDRLLCGIVEGLPDHLNPGGTFHALSIGMDTADAPFESRVRSWLGPDAARFDVIFAFGSSMTPAEFARSLVTRAASHPGDYERWVDVFGRRQVRDVVYGALVIRRFAGDGEPQTRRVVAGPETGPAGFAALLDWFTWLRRPDLEARVLESRPVLAQSTQLVVRHVVDSGQFVPNSFRLTNERAAFKVQLDTDPWVAAMLAAFDGRPRVVDVRDAMRTAGAMPEGVTSPEVARLVCLLAERGFLQLAEPDGPADPQGQITLSGD